MATRKRRITDEQSAEQLAKASPIPQLNHWGEFQMGSRLENPHFEEELSYVGELDAVPEPIILKRSARPVQQLIAVAGPLGARSSIERELLRVRLIAILEVVRRTRAEMQDQMSRLIASMMPASAVPLPPQVLQARRNAVARDTLLHEFGALNSSEIGELAGSKSPNRAALAHRWKSDGRIFAVPHQGTNYFPGFQFSGDGQPLPAIGNVVRLLAERLSPWELALWFTGRNGWLGGRRPVDLLGSEPARVVTAAEREAEERVF